MSNITVLGAGSWGTAVATMLSKNGHNVTLWSKFPSEVEQLNKDRQHKKLLAGIEFPDELMVTNQLDSLKTSEIVIMAVPSFAVRETAKAIKGVFKQDSILVNISKGFEKLSNKRLSVVITEELEPLHFAVLSGPSHAEEVAKGVPTSVVVASLERETAEKVQDTCMNSRFRIYITPDVVGVELGGALKNVIAICAGISDGMGYGDNTKALLMTRGIVEISRIGVAMGAYNQTFAGLSGIGDLIVTCSSKHSRNRRAGILIGKGQDPLEAVEDIGMVVEGYAAAKAAYNLVETLNIDAPIIRQAYYVLFENKNSHQALDALMSRSKKHESEGIWNSINPWELPCKN